MSYLFAPYIHMSSDPVDVAGDNAVLYCEAVLSDVNKQVLA